MPLQINPAFGVPRIFAGNPSIGFTPQAQGGLGFNPMALSALGLNPMASAMNPVGFGNLNPLLGANLGGLGANLGGLGVNPLAFGGLAGLGGFGNLGTIGGFNGLGGLGGLNGLGGLGGLNGLGGLGGVNGLGVTEQLTVSAPRVSNSGIAGAKTFH
ncbi:MAG: hypothetical protein ACM3ZA_08605 [Bacillota bacterium]